MVLPPIGSAGTPYAPTIRPATPEELNPPKRRPAEPPCPHLGAPLWEDDETPAVESVPCGCGADENGETKTRIWECLLFRDDDGDPGECIPLRMREPYRSQYQERAGALRLCQGCPRQLP